MTRIDAAVDLSELGYLSDIVVALDPQDVVLGSDPEVPVFGLRSREYLEHWKDGLHLEEGERHVLQEAPEIQLVHEFIIVQLLVHEQYIGQFEPVQNL